MLRKLLITTLFAAVLTGCQSPPSSVSTNNLNNASKASPTAPINPASSPVMPKNGDYPGVGKVTKINLEQGSIELDHEEIVSVMPAMRMEFFVSDKRLLDGLKISEKIDFTLRYKDHTETIVDIKKTK